MFGNNRVFFCIVMRRADGFLAFLKACQAAINIPLWRPSFSAAKMPVGLLKLLRQQQLQHTAAVAA